MMSTNNIREPANGKPIIGPSQYIVLGLYYITTEQPELVGDQIRIESAEALQAALENNDIVLRNPEAPDVPVKVDDPDKTVRALKAKKLTAHLLPRFFSIGEIEHARDNGAGTLHTPIKARYRTVDEDMNPVTRVFRTTPGRMLLAEILPRNPKVPFDLVNRLLTKREISHVIDMVNRHCGQKETCIFADRMMSTGFTQACKAGLSFGKDDLVVPGAKEGLINEAQAQVKEYEQQYLDGLITRGEKYNKVVDVWSTCTERVAEAIMSVIQATSDGPRNRSEKHAAG